ncbi:putative signal peptide and transmembrane protein [Rhodopirellula islandica]|uniref:Signal peptide and transmembrane protein n=1 Tax=Rhodopirellula islandica TaxID=595434 RepID=A0A0J1BN83_RHOIS|nr:hypothetical protein [Rhodopirellula islandica]KLU07910.1 putative signal peptide and transmembrane protein [Rhodopirellula islandica]
MNFIQALSIRSRSPAFVVTEDRRHRWSTPGRRWALLLMGCWWVSSATLNAQPSDPVSANPVSESTRPATKPASLRTMLNAERTSTLAALPATYQLTDQTAAETTAADPDYRAAERLQTRFAALEKPVRGIRVVQADVAGSFPENHAAELLAPLAVRVIESDWHAIPTYDRYPVCFFHQPLHFEERNLERCGDGHGCLTNAISTFWFLSNTAIWPYRMASEPPCQCVLSAGDCKTCQTYSCPVEPLHTDSTQHEFAKGVLAEAAVIAGFTFLVL